jgi:type VI secretion system secreted protein Hcp
MPIAAYIRFLYKGTPLLTSVMLGGIENTAEVHELSHYVGYVETNEFTGMVTRCHTPIILQIPLGSITPRLYELVCTGEKIEQAEILWFQFDEELSGGKSLKNYFTHLFENVKICKVRSFFHNVKAPESQNNGHSMLVEFRYEYVTWTYAKGNLAFKDNWDYVYADEIPEHHILTQQQIQDELDSPAPLTDDLAIEIAAYNAKKQEPLSNIKSNLLDKITQIKIISENGAPAIGISFNDKDKNKVADSKLNYVSGKDIEGLEVVFHWNEIAMNFQVNNDIRIA